MTDNMLKYKEFIGSVEYSDDNECFFGKILGITDLVTFEGDSVVALKNAFTEAVEDYIVLCREASKGLSLNALVEKAINDLVHA
jgi:predicted HicB family RNase H-like nuclease